MELFQHVIGGSEVPSIDGQTMPDIDPYTQEQWADVALGGRADADKAVAAAREAFDNGPWANPSRRRCMTLRAVRGTFAS